MRRVQTDDLRRAQIDGKHAYHGTQTVIRLGVRPLTLTVSVYLSPTKRWVTTRQSNSPFKTYPSLLARLKSSLTGHTCARLAGGAVSYSVASDIIGSPRSWRQSWRFGECQRTDLYYCVKSHMSMIACFESAAGRLSVRLHTGDVLASPAGGIPHIPGRHVSPDREFLRRFELDLQLLCNARISVAYWLAASAALSDRDKRLSGT